jgi:hypothetical protein
MSSTGMEYSDGLVEEYIMDSGKSIRGMVTDIIKESVVLMTIHSTRMINEMETELKLRMANYTHANMRKITSSLKLNILLDFAKN